MTRTAGELLIDLVGQHPNKKAEIIRFCDINADTLKNWLNGTSPRGLRQTKLFLYLIQHDMKPVELERTKLDLLRLMALVATGAVSPEIALNDALGSSSGGPQQIWKYFRADNVPLAASLERLSTWLCHAPDGHDMSREHQADELLKPVHEVPALQPAPLLVELSTSDPAHLIADNLAALLSAAFPLAKRLESDDFTDTDRQRFRDAIGEDQFFALSNALTRLSGVQARSMTRPT